MASSQYNSRVSLSSSDTLNQTPSFKPYPQPGNHSEIELQGLVEKGSGGHTYNTAGYPSSSYEVAQTPLSSFGKPSTYPTSPFAGEPEKSRPPLTSILYMPAFLLAAVGVAAAHHFFNRYLHSKTTETIPPVWAIRAGTAAAFAFKTVVAVAAGTAYVQRMWATLRKRTLTVEGIDALFGGASHVQNVFLSGELWKNAKLSLLMAFWLLILPLSAVFTPATLTVINSTSNNDTQCAVPSGDINNPAFANQFAVIDNGFYARPSPLLKRAAVQVLTGQEPSWPSPCGTNCSYNYQFQGLSLNCSEEDPELTSEISFGQTELYNAITMDRPDETGLYVSYLRLKWSSKGVPGFADSALFCVPWITTFDVAVNYNNSGQQITIKNSKKETFFGKPESGALPISMGEVTKVVFASLMDSVYDNLKGTLESTSGGTGTNYQIALSEFVEQSGSQQQLYQFKDVKAGIEKIMIQSSLSIMSLAAKFDPKLQAQSTCTLLNNTLVYDYKPFLLLVSYGAAIAIGVVSAVIGFQSIFGPNKGKPI
ncbi:hypothetical protein FRC02_006091 [Tulasnella sp. 418]|nr:hypothetical protein FRC02_006091 [Tulasnella sp. 418]